MSVSNRIHQLFEQLRNADVGTDLEIGNQIFEESKTLDAIDPLIMYLQDDNWKIRQYTVRALGNFEDPIVAQHLIKQLGQEDDEEVQVAIVTSLRYQKTLLAVQALIECARDLQQTVWVRSTAVTSIAFSTMINIVDPLFELLTDPSGDFETEIVDSIFSAFQQLDENENGIPVKLTRLLSSRTIPVYCAPKVGHANGQFKKGTDVLVMVLPHCASISAGVA